MVDAVTLWRGLPTTPQRGMSRLEQWRFRRYHDGIATGDTTWPEREDREMADSTRP